MPHFNTLGEYGIVYKCSNVTNGKTYIGQTVVSLSSRKSQHEYYANKNANKDKFHAAIRKYGENCFVWEIIDYAKDRHDLDVKEIYWIEYYNSVQDGYNLESGGGAGIPCNESREKMRQSAIGNKGHLGFKHSKETKQKMSISQKSNLHLPKSKKGMTWKLINNKRIWLEMGITHEV